VRKLYAVVMALVVCCVTTTAAVQDTTGAIGGRIVDAHGLPLPRVSVAATGAQGARNTITDADGRFVIPFLTPGAYLVHAELQGFSRSIDRTCRCRLDRRSTCC
jgi:Carboxypeptidase regulatory-like domain